MRARFSDSKFRAAHGKSARGEGMWAFSFEGDEDMNEWFFFSGSFGAAKKAAAAEAKRRGAQFFEVLS
tara:strand:+ start:133 stop:336 length:204 start_codon:yes stop_codon:yes gene_type:complete